MYDRYGDIEQFITDPNELQLTNGSEVLISREDEYGISVDLQGHVEDFDALRPFIALAARNICALDNAAQRFDRLHGGNGHFPYDLTVVFIDVPYVILEYWGREENTQFDVVFAYEDPHFSLKSFGTISDIPADWDKPASESERGKPPAKGGLLHKLFPFL